MVFSKGDVAIVLVRMSAEAAVDDDGIDCRACHKPLRLILTAFLDSSSAACWTSRPASVRRTV